MAEDTLQPPDGMDLGTYSPPEYKPIPRTITGDAMASGIDLSREPHPSELRSFADKTAGEAATLAAVYKDIVERSANQINSHDTFLQRNAKRWGELSQFGADA